MGTVFINPMFCVVAPMAFASISSAVANMPSRKRAGRIMGVTVAAFAASMINAAGDYVVSFIVSRFVDGRDWLDRALAKNGPLTDRL